jgi:DNA-3-methyladenine glycosylase
MSPVELHDILRADVVAGAKALLGATIVRGALRAQIVETEAYRSRDDPASHAFRGVTPRNGVMFGDAGRAYVYFNYGVHWMLNVTALSAGEAAGVLIRAAIPLEGLETMRARRGGLRDEQLLSGPGKLTQALAITGADNGLDLFDVDGTLYFEPPASVVRSVCGPRVGIAVGKGHDILWRFADEDSLRWVSRPAPPASEL